MGNSSEHGRLEERWKGKDGREMVQRGGRNRGVVKGFLIGRSSGEVEGADEWRK